MSEKKDQLPIRCPQEIANGVYANLGIVNYNQEEFILDFIFLHPNTKSGEVRSRVVLHPNHVRRLIDTMTKQLADYESKHANQSSNDDDDDGIPPITLSFN
jgi:hypothetical protein